MDTWGSFFGVNLPGREAENSPPSSAEVKNAWSYTSTSPYFYMAWSLIKHRDNFILFYLRKFSLGVPKIWKDNIKMDDMGLCFVNGTGSESCPVAGFGISSVGVLGNAVRVLFMIISQTQQ
jgi:hypothetical protein